MKYAIGYQIFEGKFSSLIRDFTDCISEIYFPWIDNSSGRSSLSDDRGYIDWSAKDTLLSDLKYAKSLGLKLDLLFNGNCYGENAVSEYLSNYICSVIDYLDFEGCSVDIVTTTSPFISHIVKNKYGSIEVRASVNMRIGSVKGMEYLSESFDSFYLRRDYNRDFDVIDEMYSWAKQNGKGLLMLANSGCMRDCSAQTFHDNAVSHETEIAEKKNVSFDCHNCWKYLNNPDHWVSVLQNTWVRPEDIHNYEGYFKTVKLATRMHALPGLVISSYARGKYFGNLLDLFEPGFGPIFAPYIIDNTKFPNDWFQRTSSCDKKCHKCGYCSDVLKTVVVNSEM